MSLFWIAEVRYLDLRKKLNRSFIHDVKEEKNALPTKKFSPARKDIELMGP